jgi:hypothetical protein
MSGCSVHRNVPIPVSNQERQSIVEWLEIPLPVYELGVEFEDSETYKYLVNDCSKKIVNGAEVAKSNEEKNNCILDMLSLTDSLVTINDNRSSIDMSKTPATYTKKGESYQVVLRWYSYTIATSNVPNRFGTPHRALVGIGARIISDFVAHEDNVEISNLFSLSSAAEQGKITGTLRLKLDGVSVRDNKMILPIISKLDRASINYAVNSVQMLKTTLRSEGIVVTPLVIADINNYSQEESDGGWVYLGTIVNGVIVDPMSNNGSLNMLNGNIDKPIDIIKKLSIRVSYPRFPWYTLPETTKGVSYIGPDTDHLRVILKDYVVTGKNRVWGKIEIPVKKGGFDGWLGND